jgi:SAM-dependent methyltransferase
MGIYAKLKAACLAHAGEAGILDFGCGLGYATHFLGARGVDMNPEAISRARLLFPDTQYEAMSLDGLLAQGKRYGVVSCVNVLEHLEDGFRQKFFEALPSLLAPGGRLVVAYDSMYHPLQLLSGLIHPGMLLTDPTHVHCWPQYKFRKLLAQSFTIESEQGGNILSLGLPLANAFATARLYVCIPKAGAARA